MRQNIAEKREIFEDIKEMFKERAGRSKFIYNFHMRGGRDAKLLIKALRHDLNLCQIGYEYCQSQVGGAENPFTASVIVDTFSPSEFALSFGSYSFKLLDTSDEGYSKDFNLRQKFLELERPTISKSITEIVLTDRTRAYARHDVDGLLIRHLNALRREPLDVKAITRIEILSGEKVLLEFINHCPFRGDIDAQRIYTRRGFDESFAIGHDAEDTINAVTFEDLFFIAGTQESPTVQAVDSRHADAEQVARVPNTVNLGR